MTAAGGAAFYALGCRSGGGGASNTANVTPYLLAREFVAGENNRFVVGLLDGDGNFVRDADVHAKFFTVSDDGRTQMPRGEDVMHAEELNEVEAHKHDSSGEHDFNEESVAFYVLGTPFDVAGTWAVELNARLADGLETRKVQTSFEVRDRPASPAIGEIPPASRNDTAATNSSLASLCSRDPVCGLHDTVIGDVLGGGRPLVVQFSTPAFCETRFCGPVLEVLLNAVPAYQDRVDFVHIEVWENIQEQKYRPAVREWNLPGEPFTFFMDSSGRVVGKLEAIFSEEELRSALDQLVSL